MSGLTLSVFSHLLAENGMAPVESFPEEPVLLFSEPPSIEARARVRLVLGREVRFQPAEEEAIERLVKAWRARLAPEMEAGEGPDGSEYDEEYLKDLASDAPVIRLVNHLLERALDLKASDVHFEPEEDEMGVRVRVDGVMSRLETLPAHVTPAVSSRLKLMAKLDIGEKRLPQDGRIQYAMGGRQLDMRVSTLPGVHGESIVLRILDRGDVHVSLEKLGMPEEVLAPFRRAIRQPHGMLLVTGPTGSGKTTTLYATLEKIRDGQQKIITVEDPVEYQLQGVTQIHVNAKIGLSFAAGLRSILRQDPDIVMVGEIRDRETAEIAIESALTGHLVLSTLHTNDAAGALVRLQDMGIDSYLISSSVLAVLAQRLVRQVCPSCAVEQPLGDDEAAALGLVPGDITHYRRGSGCERCGGSGYRGRLGIYELLTLSDQVRHQIAAGADANVIRGEALKEGMTTLRADALEKLRAGLTTPEEIVRVTRQA
ncbi:GspE/PulE family protein [Endothiovibrio diazotrophicus]